MTGLCTKPLNSLGEPASAAGARSEPQANEGRQGGFAGRSPASLVGVVGFEPTTLTPQRSGSSH